MNHTKAIPIVKKRKNWLHHSPEYVVKNVGKLEFFRGYLDRSGVYLVDSIIDFNTLKPPLVGSGKLEEEFKI